MTTKDIKSVQILFTTNDNQHLLAITDNEILIQYIASVCEFYKLKDSLFENYSLKELIKD